MVVFLYKPIITATTFSAKAAYHRKHSPTWLDPSPLTSSLDSTLRASHAAPFRKQTGPGRLVGRGCPPAVPAPRHPPLRQTKGHLLQENILQPQRHGVVPLRRVLEAAEKRLRPQPSEPQKRPLFPQRETREDQLPAEQHRSTALVVVVCCKPKRVVSGAYSRRHRDGVPGEKGQQRRKREAFEAAH